MSLRDDIEQRRKELKIPARYFREVRYFAYQNILKNIGEKFTTLGARATEYLWFNHYLKGEVFSLMPKGESEVSKIIKKIIPNQQFLWFIAAETYHQKPKYWLYESNLNCIIAILDEMYLFDFYLVDKKYSWLITQEHHGILLAVGEPICSNLKQDR